MPLSEDEIILENAFNKFFLNHDHEALDEIREKMKGSVTKEEKRRALADIDKRLRDNSGMFGWPTLAKGILTQVLPGGSMNAVAIHVNSTKDRREYARTLRDLRKVVSAVKTTD